MNVMYIGCDMKIYFIVYRVCFCRQKVVGRHTYQAQIITFAATQKRREWGSVAGSLFGVDKGLMHIQS